MTGDEVIIFEKGLNPQHADQNARQPAAASQES